MIQSLKQLWARIFSTPSRVSTPQASILVDAAAPAESADKPGDIALAFIRTGHPRFLSYLSDAELDLIRPHAENEYLTGERPRAGVWRSIHLSGKYEADVAIRMLVFQALSLKNIADWRASGVVTGVDILPAADSCSFCKRARHHFSLDDVPDVPRPGCTHKMGCRCAFLPKV